MATNVQEHYQERQYSNDAGYYNDDNSETSDNELNEHDGNSEETDPVDANLLDQYINSDNIAKLLTQDQLSAIGREALMGYDIDRGSRVDWEKQTKAAMKLATQVIEGRDGPWANSANVKYPLITTGAIQFHARAYPAIVRGSHIVMGTVTGADPEGKKQAVADRIGLHMSHQLMNVMEEWEEDTDKLLLMIAIVGCAFRKVYFDKTLMRNVSELVSAEDVIYNHRVPFGKLRRISHEIKLWGNDVLERIRTGLFLDINIGIPDESTGEEDGYYEFIEQQCWYDLDEDGYREPYIVTLRKDSGEVARIVARYDHDSVFLNAKNEVYRIKPTEYWVKYPFIPNPDGGSYDIGLGTLISPMNETVNTIFNQLLDAGTLANSGGGFIAKGLRMKGGPVKFRMGEYVTLDSAGNDIRNGIVPLQFPGPSPVLFQLLGMIVEAAKGVLSVTDIMSGEPPAANTPATTTLAMIEQGMKVFSAIYKRVHRSLKRELKLLYRLNQIYGEPQEYYKVDGKEGTVTTDDYQVGVDIVPVSDPNLVSDAQMLAMAEALMQFKGDPFFDQKEIRRRYIMALKEPEIDKLLLKEPVTPPPDPALLKAQASLIEAHSRVEISQQQAIADIEKTGAQTAQAMADSLLKLAQTKSQELANQIQAHSSLIEQFMSMGPLLQQFMEQVNATAANNGTNEDGGGSPGAGGNEPQQLEGAEDSISGGNGGMAQPEDNTGGISVPEGQPQEVNGGLGSGELLPNGSEPSAGT